MATLETAPLEVDSPAPVTRPQKSLRTRIGLSIRIWMFKAFVSTAIAVVRLFNIRNMARYKPTYTKKYPVGARLENDVWLPKSYKAGDKLFLYIDIHGGGFTIGDPRADSEWCNYLSNEQGLCVVSVNYRKAPRYPYPYQGQDVTEIIEAVLNDPDLPVDKTKVAVGGFSAGAKHSMSSVLRDELQGKIKGLVLFYPVLDFSNRFQKDFKPTKDGSADILLKTRDLFLHAYIGHLKQVDVTDPRLSPSYARRSRLPEKMFFIGAEYDYLYEDAELTAKGLIEAEGIAQRQGDENEWTADGIRFMKVHDAQHGFNFVRRKGPEAEAKRLKITEEVYADVARWLKKEVYR